jgi:hypothetical protein
MIPDPARDGQAGRQAGQTGSEAGEQATPTSIGYSDNEAGRQQAGRHGMIE